MKSVFRYLTPCSDCLVGIALNKNAMLTGGRSGLGNPAEQQALFLETPHNFISTSHMVFAPVKAPTRTSPCT